jgi:hypothetical protein
MLALGQESGPTPPIVVGMHVEQDGTGDIFWVWRVWNDGAVDRTRASFKGIDECDINIVCPPAVVVPGTCMADVDRDGNVATADLLNVLEDWGACDS